MESGVKLPYSLRLEHRKGNKIKGFVIFSSNHRIIKSLICDDSIHIMLESNFMFLADIITMNGFVVWIGDAKDIENMPVNPIVKMEWEVEKDEQDIKKEATDSRMATGEIQ